VAVPLVTYKLWSWPAVLTTRQFLTNLGIISKEGTPLPAEAGLTAPALPGKEAASHLLSGGTKVLGHATRVARGPVPRRAGLARHKAPRYGYIPA